MLTSSLILALTISTLNQTAPAAPPASSRRPNVVILFPDQLRWCELGCYGHPLVRSPNIDRLAAAGARFTRGFSNYPVCSPARSVLLTGRYARANGVSRNQDDECQPGRPNMADTTLAETMSRAGYATGLVGKWHLSPRPQTLGFAESQRTYFRHRYYKQIFSLEENELEVYDGYAPEHETAAAVDFIQRHRGNPFLLYVAYGPPHMPVSELPDGYRNMYDPAKVVIRDNALRDGRPVSNPEWFKVYMWDFQYYMHKPTWTRELPPGFGLRELTALYDGQITAIDDCVGQVLGALKNAGLEDDTIVLLTSDHGDLLGSHGQFNKNMHYDEAIRVPFIWRYPGRIAPRVIDTQVVSLIDVMPTILDLCGVPIPESVQGTSLAAVLTGKKQTVGANAAVIETGQADGVRTLRYVYYTSRDGANRPTARRKNAEAASNDPGQTPGPHLFDVDRDPFELHDLAREESHREILQEHARLLKDSPLMRFPAHAPNEVQPTKKRR